MLEHPEIGWIERTGYPSWLQETDYKEDDADDDDSRCKQADRLAPRYE